MLDYQSYSQNRFEWKWTAGISIIFINIYFVILLFTIWSWMDSIGPQVNIPRVELSVIWKKSSIKFISLWGFDQRGLFQFIGKGASENKIEKTVDFSFWRRYICTMGVPLEVSWDWPFFRHLALLSPHWSQRNLF